MLGLSPIGASPLGGGGTFLTPGVERPATLFADIRLDGGDDYYYPAWMRVMGRANAEADAAAAEDRYLTYYLVSPNAGTRGISNPGILTDSTPAGSICRDKDGNVFYSVTLGGESFSGLTDGDLSDLFPLVGNGEYHPVGLA